MLLLLFLLSAKGASLPNLVGQGSASGGQDTTSASGSFNANCWVNTPSLYSLDLGYGNPALASGLNGFILNPAALADIKGTEFSSAVSFGAKSEFDVPLVFDMKGDIGEVEVPATFSFGQPTRINTIGVGITTFIGKIGIGFIEGFGLGGEMNGKGVLCQTLNDTIQDTLRKAEIPDLPEDIPVEWLFSIPFKFTLDGNTKFDFSEKKFFVGFGNAIGPLRTGLGLAYKPLRGKITGTAVLNANAPCTLECNATQGSWIVDAVGSTKLNENIAEDDANILLTGNEIDLIAGMQLKLGPLMFGGVISLMPATSLKISGGNSFTYINNIPKISIVDTPRVDVIGDTIRGTIDVKLSDFPDTTETDKLKEEYEIPGRIDIQTGLGLKLGPLTAGAGVGITLPSLNFYINAGCEIKVIIPLRASLEIRNESYQLKDEDPVFIPYYTINLGTSLLVRYARVDVGIRTNLFSTLFGNLDLEKGQMPNLLDGIAPVIGLSFKF